MLKFFGAAALATVFALGAANASVVSISDLDTNGSVVLTETGALTSTLDISWKKTNPDFTADFVVTFLRDAKVTFKSATWRRVGTTLVDVGGTLVRLGFGTNTSGNPEPVIVPGASVFALAGVYTVSLTEPSNPRAAHASFDIAAVPLPAGGLLLLAGVAGIAALRRRKAA